MKEASPAPSPGEFSRPAPVRFALAAACAAFLYAFIPAAPGAEENGSANRSVARTQPVQEQTASTQPVHEPTAGADVALAQPPVDPAQAVPATPSSGERTAAPVPYGARGYASAPRHGKNGTLFLPRLALLPARVALRAVTLPVRWTGALLSPTGWLQNSARAVPGGPYVVPLIGIEPEFGPNLGLRIAHGSPFDPAGCLAYRLAYGLDHDQLYSVTARSRDMLLTPEARGWSYALSARYDLVPDKHFFGLGNATLRDRLTYYTLERYILSSTLRYAPTERMRWDFTLSAHRDQMRSGSALDEGDVSIEQRFPNEVYAPGLVFDAQNIQAQVGLVLDGRDHRGRPTSGAKSESYFAYASGTGADLVDYVHYGTELEYYLPVHPRHVLALRAVAEEVRTSSTSATGRLLPIKITERPSLGGPTTLRGYLRDRFLDNASVLGTIEYRYQLSPVVEASLFADFGKVLWRLLDFDFTGLHRSWGAGFRFATDDWMFVRVQGAMSDEDVVVTATLEPEFDAWDRRERR